MKELDGEELAKQYDDKLMFGALEEEEDPTKRKFAMSIWDYGGQEVFYALHHVFLTEFGVYCVVFDMSRLVDPSATDETRSSSLDLLQFWLRSIQMHASSAPVFIFGTHKDMVSSTEEHLKINSLLKDSLRLASNRQVIAYSEKKLWFFPVDNKAGLNEDPVLRLVREQIISSVSEKSYVTMEVPVSWIRVLDLLLERRNDTPYLTLSEAADIALDAGVTSKVSSILAFFHELGVLCYFDMSLDLRQLVVLDPQWLVNAFTKVIRDFELHQLDLMTDLEFRREFASDLERLETRALVSESLLFRLWKDETPSSRKFLLLLMKQMSLLCEWLSEDASDDEEQVAVSKLYLVPSLLDMNSKIATGHIPDVDPVQFFYLDFSDSFLPHGLFPRLTALVVTHSVTVFEGSMPPKLNRNIAIASFGSEGFIMEQRRKENQIKIGIFSAQASNSVRNLILSMLEKLRDEVMGKDLKFKVVLLVEDAKGKLNAVSLRKIEKARERKTKTVWSENASEVLVKDADAFFSDSPLETENENLDIQPLPESIQYHVFISYYQQTAMDQVGKLYELLRNKGIKVWYDQMCSGELTLPAMKEGVQRSRYLLVFLTKSVLTRSFCQTEIREANRLGKRIIFVHEEDRRNQGFAELYEIRDEAPDDLKSLFQETESLPFRRRLFEQEAMLTELIKRILC